RHFSSRGLRQNTDGRHTSVQVVRSAVIEPSSNGQTEGQISHKWQWDKRSFCGGFAPQNSQSGSATRRPWSGPLFSTVN
ncbi:MAG: hypothetical protein FWD12_16165, partial [Alphaproteobacteria bacterium]|nr:hypothetical protein [Alphaproteobacteria bacterium]